VGRVSLELVTQLSRSAASRAFLRPTTQLAFPGWRFTLLIFVELPTGPCRRHAPRSLPNLTAESRIRFSVALAAFYNETEHSSVGPPVRRAEDGAQRRPRRPPASGTVGKEPVGSVMAREDPELAFGHTESFGRALCLTLKMTNTWRLR
jgi:hypothetical protein